MTFDLSLFFVQLSSERLVIVSELLIKLLIRRMVMAVERKREVINVCLQHFIEKGLSEVSTRSLSSALQLQNAGLYYYFDSKDEVVILCAEEAALRLESALFPSAIALINEPDYMITQLLSKAKEMAPTMRFLVSVCASERYKDAMKAVLDKLAERYSIYTLKIANLLNCSSEEIEPYVYMTITTIANYMIFNETELIKPQIRIIINEIKRLNVNCRTNDFNKHN